MPFDLDTYLNSLPDDTSVIDVSNKGLKNLPDLSRFKNLIKLDCSVNQLISLPPLNEKLEILCCYNNRLTSIPPLNKNLKKLDCSSNLYLTSLPPLNENLEHLSCRHNRLTSLPQLNENLEHLDCVDNKLTSLPQLNKFLRYIGFKYNPIYNILSDLLYNFNNPYTNQILQIKKLNKFRSLYYQLKFKKHFIKWLWKSREKQIMEKYHPKYLLENLQENTDLDEFLNNW